MIVNRATLNILSIDTFCRNRRWRSLELRKTGISHWPSLYRISSLTSLCQRTLNQHSSGFIQPVSYSSQDKTLRVTNICNFVLHAYYTQTKWKLGLLSVSTYWTQAASPDHAPAIHTMMCTPQDHMQIQNGLLIHADQHLESDEMWVSSYLVQGQTGWSYLTALHK